MENTNSSSTNKGHTLCTAGCGFYGNEAFNNMCSQCFKAHNKTDSSTAITTSTSTTSTTTNSSSSTSTGNNHTTNTDKSQTNKKRISTPPKSSPSTPTFNETSTTAIPVLEKSRKHLRSPSPNGPRVSSAPASSIASPAASTSSATDSTVAAASSSATTPTNPSDKPAQLNKGRCFKCRLKVPLAKQAANKCRCGYVFCDSHRYPDRHDCDIDYAKMDRGWY
ncbi:hypothetical protein [Parasitella parasitica]|uniref:AN1-type domain-containing protein n=1 Tax=Parasitella parasitica TaxID=35722 RepID=A0A0B7MRM8_9FUNG|nr:hypothetical protein [Parasitella parasitica]